MSLLYVYAILGAPPEGPLPPGVAGELIRLVDCGEVLAAAGEVPAAPAVEAATLRRHDDAVRRLAAATPAVVNLVSVVEAAIDALRPAADAKGLRLETALDAAGGAAGSPAFLPYVFDRFRQAESTKNRTHGGLGGGLAIVRHLVEMHGATVTAKSPGEGQGATFTVSLPLRAVRGGEPEADELADVPQTLAGRHVLLVDDDADAREILCLVLQRAGAKITLATSAAEALAALSPGQPDVLICDIVMPGGDGYALIRKIRSLKAEAGGRIPAVALAEAVAHVAGGRRVQD